MTPSEKRHAASRLRDVLPHGWRVRLAVRRNTVWCNIIQGTEELENIVKVPIAEDGTVMLNRYWLHEFIQEPFVTLFEDIDLALKNALEEMNLAHMFIRLRMGTATTRYHVMEEDNEI